MKLWPSVMWAKNKESDTLLKGKYSLTNFIRTKVKKNNGPSFDSNPKSKDEILVKPFSDEYGGKFEGPVENTERGLSDKVKELLKKKFSTATIISGMDRYINKENFDAKFDEFLSLLNGFLLSNDPKFKGEGYGAINDILSEKTEDFHIIINKVYEYGYKCSYFVAKGEYINVKESEGCGFWLGSDGQGSAQINSLSSNSEQIIKFNIV